MEKVGEKSKKWREVLGRYQMAVEELQSDLKIIDMDWKTEFGYSPIEHMKIRVKTIDSIENKLLKKGYEMTPENIVNYLFDVAGARIVTSFQEDAYLILAHLQTRDDYRICKIKDYIAKPKASGYRSIHVLAEIEVVLHRDVVWIPVEIQIRTLSRDFWAATEHKLQYKYPDGDIPTTAMLALKQT
ncbi:MAG: GTP pyrophosphokinase, partial [Culicoidibacterales bacterium]